MTNLSILNRFGNFRNFVLVVFAISLITRLIYIFYYFSQFGTTNFMDDLDYISYANEIIAQGIWVPDITKIAGNGHQVGIGWPLILSVFFYLFGQNYLLIFIFNCILSSLHVVLISLVAKEIFGTRVGIIAGLWSTLYIHFIKFTPTLLKENLIHFLLFLCLYLFIRLCNEKGNLKQLVIFSLVFAFFIHVDERYLTLLPVFAIGIFFLKKDSFRNNLVRATQFACIVGVLMIPWLIRNYNVYDRPVILAYQTSQFTDKLFGFSEKDPQILEQEYRSSYSRKNLPAYEKATLDILNGKDPNLEKYRYLKDIRMGINEGIIPYSYTFSKNLWEEFKEFYRVCRFKSGYLANGYRFMKKGTMVNNIIYILQYGILLPFFALTILYGMVKKIRTINFLTFVIVIYTCIHIFIEHALIRYRIPIDGIIIMFSIYGFFIFLSVLNIKFYLKTPRLT